MAKAEGLLLDDPFSFDRNSGGPGVGGMSNLGGGYGGSNAGPYGGIPSGIPPGLQIGKTGSMPPMSHGGFTKSNYTASEAAESDFDTHS